VVVEYQQHISSTRAAIAIAQPNVSARPGGGYFLISGGPCRRLFVPAVMVSVADLPTASWFVWQILDIVPGGSSGFSTCHGWSQS